MYGYEWTKENGIFKLTADSQIQKEIRPVYKEELDFFHMYEYWDYPDTDLPLLWAEGVRNYVLNGVRVAEAKGGDCYTKPEIVLHTDKRLSLSPVDVHRLYEVNASLMKSLEQKAIAFIRTQRDRFTAQKYAFVCAFSGGKDSIALLDLCAKALAPNEFHVVFSDTGMELSDTYQSVETAKAIWPDLHFMTAKSHLKPQESWQLFGPPASRLRWCCSVHKSVPTVLLLKELAGDGTKAVVFDGVRAEESLRRSKYVEVADGVKNTQQVNCHAILKWSSAEVFIYLLERNLIINKAYKKGIYRVGCMLCPMSAKWQDSLIAHQYPNDVAPYLSMVEDITVKAKGHLDKKYIGDGGWKARTGGNILPQGETREADFIDRETNSFNISITHATQQWVDVLPIFGAIVDDSGNGKYTIKTKNGVVEMQYRQEEENQTIVVRPADKIDRFDISALHGIANKVAYCVGCKACVPQCPTGAFQITDGKIHIRYSKCVHCYNCIAYTDRACMVSKSLQVKVKKMKNPDQYKNFGLRQPFLEHFMAVGIKCFDKKKTIEDIEELTQKGITVLGDDQYTALRRWLCEGGVLSSSTVKDMTVTPLGEKLISIGAYNPLTWAVIWANLAYNSEVSKCYCLNAEAGCSYAQENIADMLDDSYSMSTRKNAAAALASTFRDSPIGTYLGQGLAISKGVYLRDGWSMPDGVALLYSLYLYAEHTNHHKFTLTELYKAHENPEATGVSPGDVYGLDQKKLRECIQGLALAYPDKIRVSFINDLDNIVLEESVSSLSILDLAEE